MGPSLTQEILADFSPTATTFIVTIYGDVVVPRGGVLWMGNVIELCAGVGINESLARTAVSRLVAAGRLIGRRDGRRSHYRLAEQSQAEFADAAARLYCPAPHGQNWIILHAPELGGDAARRAGYGALEGGNWLLPDWMPVAQGLAFHAVTTAPLSDLAARLWALEGMASEYRAMLQQFAPVLTDRFLDIDGFEALILRLALVHVFRRILLRDPELPRSALPQDWPGRQARTFFDRAYLQLSAKADSFIAERLQGDFGPLLGETAETRLRLQGMESRKNP